MLEILSIKVTIPPHNTIIGLKTTCGMLMNSKTFIIADKFNKIFIQGMNIRLDKGEIKEVFLKIKIERGAVKAYVDKPTEMPEKIYFSNLFFMRLSFSCKKLLIGL